MKVLILHQHFKIPQGGGAVRSYYLASALVDKGVETVVITSHNHAHYQTGRIGGIEVHYLPVPYDNRFGFYQRIWSFVQFALKAMKVARLHRDADLVYAISVPLTTGLAARWIKRRFKIPYIFEVGDLWPDAPIEMGFIRSPILKRMLYRMEKVIYERASSVVALSPPIGEVIRKRSPGKTVHLLPNMSDTDFFAREEKRVELEEKFNVREKFVVSYIGALGVANGLQYVLQCAKACQEEDLSVHFLICGDGALADELKTSAERWSLVNITILPFRNRDGVGEIMNVTDATFICYQPVKILETGSPNKYFDGLAAGKLTIINFGGWIKEEIEREGCGVYVRPQDPKDFVVSVKPFLENPALLKKYQQAGRMLAERKYSRKWLGKRFWELVTNEVAG